LRERKGVSHRFGAGAQGCWERSGVSGNARVSVTVFGKRPFVFLCAPWWLMGAQGVSVTVFGRVDTVLRGSAGVSDTVFGRDAILRVPWCALVVSIFGYGSAKAPSPF
jgi:hypothetical protein